PHPVRGACLLALALVLVDSGILHARQEGAGRVTAILAAAEADLREGRPEAAIDGFRRAQALLGLRHLYGDSGESRPVGAYESASARLHRGLAEAYLQSDRPYAAAVEAEHGVNADERDGRLWTLLGLAHYRLANVDSAGGALERAAMLGVDDADLHWGRALVAAAGNRIPEAIDAARRARARRAEPRFALALARWSVLAGDYEEAAEALDDFLALAPDGPRAAGTRNLARFYREVSRAPANVVEPGATRLQLRFDLKRGDEIPYVPARINGHPEVYILFDTGAERNVIDREYAESIGIGPVFPGGALHGAWRESPAGHTIVDSLSLGSMTIQRIPFAVTDFERLHLRLQGDYYIAAIVNPALLLRDFLVVLDYHQQHIELERYGLADLTYAGRRTRLRKSTTPFHFAANGVWPVLPASLDGSRVLPFLVDTGASDLLVDRETAAALRIDPLHFVASAGGHTRERLRGILLDGGLSEPWDIQLHGILGFPFFRGMRMVFDYENMTLTVEN
ncbi:MAG: aspartyl protease family protein, partial [Gemmatimonadota bacterium]